MKLKGKLVWLLIFPAIILLNSCKTPDSYAIRETIALNEGWTFQMKGDTSWLPAEVPGCVHTDLLNNGKIEEPFYRTNEKQLQWIDKKDWMYRCSFVVDSLQIQHNQAVICFSGLDTYADVKLNGHLLFSAGNMFREWEVDVKTWLVPGTNILEIAFVSPITLGLEKLSALGYGLPAANDQSEAGELGDKKVSVFSRKAPYHFGWDWGPRFVTSGIWRPVELIFYDAAILKDVFYKQTLVEESHATIDAVVDIEAFAPGKYNVVLSRANEKEPLAESFIELEEGLNSLTIPFTIKNPGLWWPNGLGKQNLYHLRAELRQNDIILDTLSHKIGLRSVQLIREHDSLGKSFCFEVNGKRIFIKGANYIPNDNFLNRVSDEKYEEIVKSAAAANMNMLRVWGGGIYENDIFYELCDRYGLLVWQDFMFACSMYPGDDAFLENVTQELIDNVKRLRNHASIALWCGNNEIDAAWCEGDMNCGWGWKQQYTQEQRQVIWHSYDTLFNKIIPDIVEVYDQTRAYWPSSPLADWGVHASYSNSMGDMHYWGVWHGNEPFSAFYSIKSRFMSEYGFQSFPDFESVKKFTSQEDWNIESEVMRAHQRSGYGNSRIIDYMEKLYPVPTDFSDVLYVSQVMQAEAIKSAILAHRASKPYCMGTLFWQLNDCWPAASWSSIDYYGNWKALQYFAKKAYAPVAISFSPDSGGVQIYLDSDLPKTRIVEVFYKMIDFGGKVIYQHSLKTKLNPQRSAMILNFKPEHLLNKSNPRDQFLQVAVMENGKLLASDHYFFVAPKDLQLTDANLNVSVKKEGEKLTVKLSTDNLAKNIFLSIDGCNGRFSDNYFDLLPGEKETVTMDQCGDKVITEKDVKITCLNSLIRKPE